MTPENIPNSDKFSDIVIYLLNISPGMFHGRLKFILVQTEFWFSASKLFFFSTSAGIIIDSVISNAPQSCPSVLLVLQTSTSLKYIFRYPSQRLHLLMLLLK